MANNKKENNYRRCSLCDWCKVAPHVDTNLYGNERDRYFRKDRKTGEYICNVCTNIIGTAVYESILASDEGDDYKYLIMEADFDILNRISLSDKAKDSKDRYEGRRKHMNPRGRAGNPVQKKGWNPGDPIPDPKYALERALEAPRKAVQAVPEAGCYPTSLEPDRQPTALPEAPAAASISWQEGEGTTDER